MIDSDIYKDMAARGGGAIYVGVVGPVRTGKSTFIKRFMTELILPNAEGGDLPEMVDELPQSAAGKTVMTTEPKFVPAKPVKIKVGNAEAGVRFIDCVGFAVDGAGGFYEGGEPRLVNTMWSENPMPFTEAAEVGTQRVIRDHSTVGVIVTCDGSVTGIERQSYVPAEEKTVEELKAIGKPYVMVLNCAEPTSRAVSALKEELSQKYGCPVIAMNCKNAAAEEFTAVLREVLFQFPVTGIDIKIPDWIRVMPQESAAVSELLDTVRKASENVFVMRDCSAFDIAFSDCRYWSGDAECSLSLASGKACITLKLNGGVLFDMLSDVSGEKIEGEGELMSFVAAASEAKKNYDKIKDAFECARLTGYGIVHPAEEDLSLDKPRVVKKGANMGIRLRATAPSYHVIKVDVHGEVNPIMGNAAQSEEMVNGIMRGFENDPQGTWNTALFGKSLKNMVKEGLDGKVTALQDDARGKMRRAITRIVNEGRGGVICILL